jgi:serine/threonine-protein kinase
VQQAPPSTKVVSVSPAAAHAYDPFGGDGEHNSQAPLAVDRDPDTFWPTESYQDGIAGANKPGVGIYVDAKPQVKAVDLQVQTPQPGFKASIYGAPEGDVPSTVPGIWSKLATGTVDKKVTDFKLDTNGKAYRYYLVWITKLGSDQTRAEVAEIRLFEQVTSPAGR